MMLENGDTEMTFKYIQYAVEVVGLFDMRKRCE